MLINLAEVVRLNSNTIICVIFAALFSGLNLHAFCLPIKAIDRKGIDFFVFIITSRIFGKCTLADAIPLFLFAITRFIFAVQ